MAEVIKMPRMSDTMTEGVIVSWQKKVGDQVKSGDVLAEVETDKATMELESYSDGTLLYIGVQEGQAVPVDAVIAVIGNQGEDFQTLLQQQGGAQQAPQQNQPPAPEPKTGAQEPDQAKANAETVENQGTPGSQSAQSAAQPQPQEPQQGTPQQPQPQQPQQQQPQQPQPQQPQQPQQPEQPQPQQRQPQQPQQPLPQQPQPQQPQQPEESAQVEERVKASPLARKIASEKGVSLGEVSGSGDNGRIVKKDVENFKSAPSVPAKQPQKAPVQTIPGKESYNDVPLSQMRKTIARRLVESKFSAPHFYLTMDINMDRVMEGRKRINDFIGYKISFNDIIIRATAAAIRNHPKVNGSWMEDKLRYYDHIHIGVAIAVEEGLVVPVIKFADAKSISQISNEVKEFADKANNKKLQPTDFEGNTFTISNLGMFGIEEFTAIINPPDACILAVGAIQEKAVVANGEIIIANMMKVTLSCDHRIVDGATGAQFLQTLKQYLEEPVIILA
jgi:pyruvate dehydrogenase E2 component (dihydrolipoamide acetyltransferase)